MSKRNNSSSSNDNLSENQLRHFTFTTPEVPLKQETKTRKRMAKPEKWKKNVRKAMKQSGQEYINTRGKPVAARVPKLKKNCENCRFRCESHFSEEDQKDINGEFWTKSDYEKAFYYDNTTIRKEAARCRVRGERQRTKKYSYEYYFLKDNQRIRVCKDFYLGVLNISQMRISYLYEQRKRSDTTIPECDQRKRSQSRIINERRQLVRDHINLFEYLDAPLTVHQMYELYIKYCEVKKLEPVKEWMYRDICNHECNLPFRTQKL